MLGTNMWSDILVRGSHGDKVKMPEGQNAGPKDRQLEVGAQRAPRLLVFLYFYINFYICILISICMLSAVPGLPANLLTKDFATQRHSMEEIRNPGDYSILSYFASFFFWQGRELVRN